MSISFGYLKKIGYLFLFFTIIALLGCRNVDSLNDPKHLWSKRFGGSDVDQGSSVSVDSFGNVYITGRFGSSPIDFGGCHLSNAGDSDIYLIKYAP